MAVALARLYTFDEPLERDITTYAVIAHEIRLGRALYSDLWDHKPPAVYATYLVAEGVAGYGQRAVYLLGVGVAVATLLGVHAAGGAFAPGGVAGLWAAAFWAATCSDLLAEANQPNVETFLNVWLVWALALFLGRDSWAAGTRWAWVAGTLLAVASLYKPVILAGVLMAGVYVLAPGPRDRRAALREVAIVAAVALAAWAAVFGYFAVTGRLGAFYEAVFVYNRAYVGRPFGNLLEGARGLLTLPLALEAVRPLVALTAVGMAAGLWAGLTRPWLLWLAYAAGTGLSVSLPGRAYPHYYQLWFPLFAVGGGWALDVLRRTSPRAGPWAARGAGVVVLLALVAYQVPNYGLPAEAWSRVKYGPVFVETRQLAREIDQLLRPGESFYEWGNETGLFFETRRRPPTGVLYQYPLSGGPLAARLSARVVEDLNRAQPEILVVNRSLAARGAALGGHPVLDWAAPRYRVLPREPAHRLYALFVRRGGALDARLERAPGRGPVP